MLSNSKNAINKKLIYIPAIAIILIVIILGVIGLRYSKSILHKQLEIDALNYANMTLKYIEQNQKTKKFIIGKMDEQISIVADKILKSKNQLSNSFLMEIADDFGIDEIYYYTPQGKVTYSSTGQYLGWQASPGDPIYKFMSSGEMVHREGIRKGTKVDDYYKFSYFRDDEGNFVQLGFLADKIFLHTNIYDYQNIVDEITRDENVYYALITDKNLVEIADSDLYDVGHDWSGDHDYQEVLKGNTSVSEWFYKGINGKVLEVAVPLTIGNRVEGVLAIGLSLNSINTLATTFSIRTFGVLLLVLLILVFTQRKYIILPIKKLNEEVMGIDINKRGTRITAKEGDPF
jgi:hypothetical protein